MRAARNQQNRGVQKINNVIRSQASHFSEARYRVRRLKPKFQ